MKISSKILAIIPAKSISKRIPGKNIKSLAGKPMMAYIIETTVSLKKEGYVDRVVLSTDSQEIADIGIRFGAEVPFLRPKRLTRDDVPTREVLEHALDELRKKESYIPDYVLLLYPTSPLLKKERIKEAIEITERRGSDSVFSGTSDKGHYWVEDEGGYIRLYPKKQVNSQYQIPLVKENGAIYLTRADIMKRQYVADKADVVLMHEGENIDVDYPEDFKEVEAILKKSGGVK